MGHKIVKILIEDDNNKLTSDVIELATKEFRKRVDFLTYDVYIVGVSVDEFEEV